jgi:zinc protease
MRVIASLALITGLATTQLALAQTKITSVEGITEYRLDNGMTVLLFPDSSKPTVTVNVTYMVGSRHEGSGETGMAHLLEHMLFKGTTTRGDIKTELKKYGADFNGSTSWDRTNYFEILAATDENLHYALQLEADRMVNSRVSRQDLDSEMTVVRNEFESGENSPERVLFERVLSTAYLWHSYGRSPIGSRSDIEHVPIERLQAFYHNYYQPDNAMLVVAGKFDPAKTLTWVQEAFGAIPKPTRKLMPTYTEEPTQDGEREVVLRRVGDSQQVIAAYHTPSAVHPDTEALDVLTAILSEAPSGRLYKALVDSKKATRVEGESMELKEPGLLFFTADLRKDGNEADVEKVLLSVIDGIIKEPPSKEEVDRAKTRLLKNVELELNSSTGVGIALSESASAGDWRLLFLGRDRLEKVTPEDVARVAKLYLKSSNRTIGRFLPEATPDRTEVPATPEVASLLKDYKGKAPIEQGEDFDPTPANIDARTVRVTLPNGMKLALLSKKTRGGTVNATLSLHFGDEKSVFGKSTVAQMAGAMLMRGTAKHNRQQIQDEFDRLKARVGVNGSATGADASISTLRATFPDALRLAAEVMRQPAFPDSELELIRQSSLSRVEQGRSEPQQIAMTELNRHLYAAYPKGDPRHAATVDENIEELKAVTLADVKKFYSDFYGASHAELAVVGDFDAAEVQKLATELFGDWKTSSPFADVTRTWKKLDSVDKFYEAPDKANAFFAAGSLLDLNQDDKDYPTLLFISRLFGGDTDSRLFRRIRDKEGLSYGVQSIIRAGVKEHVGQFMVVAIANPENTPKVEAAFKDELTQLLTKGVDQAEVDTIKKAWRQEQQITRSSDNSLVGLLARNARFGWTMQREADQDAAIAGLTPAQVNAAAKKWIDPAAVSIFKAGDFKKAGVTK